MYTYNTNIRLYPPFGATELYFWLDWRPTACTYTDKKEKKILLIYKEIESGTVAKSYITNGLLIYEEIFAHFLIY